MRMRGAESAGSNTLKEENMTSVARITTISARSETSFEDAVAVGVARASETLRNVSGAWVKDQKVEVRDGTIVEWQVALEITFVLE
jgi:flavin-binding protein dodecin